MRKYKLLIILIINILLYGCTKSDNPENNPEYQKNEIHVWCIGHDTGKETEISEDDAKAFIDSLYNVSFIGNGGLVLGNSEMPSVYSFRFVYDQKEHTVSFDPYGYSMRLDGATYITDLISTPLFTAAEMDKKYDQEPFDISKWYNTAPVIQKDIQETEVLLMEPSAYNLNNQYNYYYVGGKVTVGQLYMKANEVEQSSYDTASEKTFDELFGQGTSLYETIIYQDMTIKLVKTEGHNVYLIRKNAIPKSKLDLHESLQKK